jgi:hypothetical protein
MMSSRHSCREMHSKNMYICSYRFVRVVSSITQHDVLLGLEGGNTRIGLITHVTRH